jgi:hypothetical protein
VQIKAVPGRKTDVQAAEWIARLLEHGLLSSLFAPPPGIRRLRMQAHPPKAGVDDEGLEGFRHHFRLQVGPVLPGEDQVVLLVCGAERGPLDVLLQISAVTSAVSLAEMVAGVVDQEAKGRAADSSTPTRNVRTGAQLTVDVETGRAYSPPTRRRPVDEGTNDAQLDRRGIPGCDEWVRRSVGL